MKLSFAFLAAAATISTLVSAATLNAGDIPANSELGKRLLAKARRVEDANANDNSNVATWLSGFSVKFQGCFNIQQWNPDADANNGEVRIATKNLARFRLCPSSSCSANKAAGCSSGYGDYIIDMEDFVYEYYDAELTAKENTCNSQLATCGCEDGDDSCSTTCFTNSNMKECIQWESDVSFGVLNYLKCAQYKFENGGADGVEYYLGPYCASQGGSVYLGLFLDNTCTTVADSSYGATTFAQYGGGLTIPYNNTSLASETCLSCVKEADQNNENADQQSSNVLDACSNIYQKSGKCESNLPSGTVSSVNSAACNYIEGVKIARADGVITTSGHRPNPVVTAFIVIFAMAFCAMGFYVFYLRNRLGVKKTRLI